VTKSATTAAVVKGTFLRPGISKNKRLYTTENIGKAVSRMQEAIKSPTGLPITMATSHAAAYGDDATATVGRVTKVLQRTDGSAYFEADIANTTNGRDVAVGTVGKFVKGISIRGGWMSQPKYAEGDEGVVTADDMAVVGIDFTSRPGVEGAQIEDANFVESYDGGMSKVFFESIEEAEIAELFNEETDEEAEDKRISEAVTEALNIILEKDTAKPYGDVKYADPGYQSDKKARYPIDTAAHTRAAWAYINVASNASAYSSAQVSRIKSRIKSAAKKFGISVTEEFNSIVDDFKSLIEDYASMNIYNGAGSVSISGSTDDAGKLAAVALRVAASAVIALNALDPDADGDIDLSGGDSSDSDSDESSDSQCLLCDGPLVDGNMYCPTCGAPVPTAESTDDALIQTNKEEAMTAPIEKTAEELAAETAATESVVTAAPEAQDINKIVAEAVAAALAADKAAQAAAVAEAAEIAATEAAAVVAEAAKPQTFTLEEATAMAVAASKTAVTEAAALAKAEYEAAPTRKGVVGSNIGTILTRDDTLDESELAKLDQTSFRRIAGAAWNNQPNWNRKFAAADAANGY
jgi:uncharacterized Zn finger protein (UPF0148 family)